MLYFSMFKQAVMTDDNHAGLIRLYRRWINIKTEPLANRLPLWKIDFNRDGSFD